MNGKSAKMWGTYDKVTWRSKKAMLDPTPE